MAQASSSPSYFPLPDLPIAALSVLSGLGLFLFVALTPTPVFSAEQASAKQASALRGSKSPDVQVPQLQSPTLQSAPADSGLRGTVLGFSKPRLQSRDRFATLAAVRTALTEVADGSTYVWSRNNGALTGLIRPMHSFASEDGRICRSLRVTLMAGPVTRTAEGRACRDADGIWSLERL